MIPMTVSFFMNSGESKFRSRMNAVFYGFSIIAIYTIIGTLVAVLFGPGAANWLSTHWLPNVVFFAVFVIFAFSFFGMFEIVLPSWLVNKSDQQVDRGGLMGSFFMALTLVLVSFSCTGPIVGAILVESAGGQILKPIIGMFGFSLAFALPFTLFAHCRPNLPLGNSRQGSLSRALDRYLCAPGFLPFRKTEILSRQRREIHFGTPIDAGNTNFFVRGLFDSRHVWRAVESHFGIPSTTIDPRL
jgi:cytochrome c biogenesis protein CcdA